MKILVTGGLGFIGSNLVDILVEDPNNEVTVIDDLSSESSSTGYSNDKAWYFIGDITKIFSYKHFVGKSFDVIFHLAAKARIQPSFDDPSDYFKTNALGTSEIMEFARISKSGIVVYATTSSKNHGTKFLTPYTHSKVVGEDILRLYSEIYGMNTAMATFYNVYGPREPKNGEFATVVAKFLRQYKNDEKITIVGNGLQTRDFTHVKDVCEGLIKISEGQWKAHNFDLGRGEPIRIIDLAKQICEDDYSKIMHTPLRKNEGMHTMSSWKKTQSLIKWRAKIKLKEYINQINK